jgi:hypothetical protein
MKPEKLILPDGVDFTIQLHQFTFKLSDGNRSKEFFNKIQKHFFNKKELLFNEKICYIHTIEHDPDGFITCILHFPEIQQTIMGKVRDMNISYNPDGTIR